MKVSITLDKHYLTKKDLLIYFLERQNKQKRETQFKIGLSIQIVISFFKLLKNIYAQISI